MTRIVLLSSEPLRARMAGIGIRYLELARRLPAFGIEPILVAPVEGQAIEVRACCPEGGEADGPGSGDVVEVRPFERGALRRLLADCQGAVAQGQLANDLVLEFPELPVAIDLYDPWLVENFHYTRSLGLDPFRNDHATWVLQMSRGDFFLCSCEEQRLFYLGFLTALGRVNPQRVEHDPVLERLIAVVPFGVPDRLPAYEPWLPAREPGSSRLLFGGLYDWYDPDTALQALAQLERAGSSLLFVRTPNQESTPQALLERLDRAAHRLGLPGRVQVLDWIPYERRYDLLRDVDLLVSTFRPGLEAELSLRTRFLDALVVGCPAISTRGGALARLLEEHKAGWVVPPGDARALAAALEEVLRGGEAVKERIERGRALAREFEWNRVLQPLVDFCREPAADPTKAAFAHRPETRAPADPLPFRLRRWLKTRVVAS